MVETKQFEMHKSGNLIPAWYTNYPWLKLYLQLSSFWNLIHLCYNFLLLLFATHLEHVGDCRTCFEVCHVFLNSGSLKLVIAIPRFYKEGKKVLKRAKRYWNEWAESPYSDLEQNWRCSGKCSNFVFKDWRKMPAQYRLAALIQRVCKAVYICVCKFTYLI